MKSNNTPTPDELRRNLWSNSPRCECCTGPNDVCRADKPCNHCSNFFSYIKKLLAQTRNKTLEEVLAAGPKDLKLSKGESNTDYFYGYGNNQANAEWRTKVKALMGEGS